MPTYRKEKNIVFITLDENKTYRLDINTGVIYGVRGKPIKTIPNRPQVERMFWRNRESSNLEGFLYEAFCRPAISERAIELLQKADKLDAVGVPFMFWSYGQVDFLAEHLREYVAWKKEHKDERFEYAAFHETIERKALIQQYGALFANEENCRLYNRFKGYINNPTIEEFSALAHFVNRAYLFEYEGEGYGAWEKIRKYFEMCRKIGKTPEKTNNFMREYVETKRLYEQRKAEYDNRRMRDNYEKQSKAWDFEYGGYRVVIPTCGQDIVTEGEQMHHCVGGYVNRVVEGRCYIVFIRKTDAPDDCYITCEVYPNGNIGQYFLAYDRYISTEEDKDFRAKFQNHLRAVWCE